VAGAAGWALIYFSPYRWQRMTTYLNPWDDPYNTDFQLSQALIAFGRGEVTGVGLGNGIQKQFYLPEAHTDFIMAVVGEEFGLIGTLGVILLFAFITWRAFQIGAVAEERGERFAAYTAYGLGLWIGLQAFINIGVNVGMLPTKGLTLPFMSYGGNSIIVVCLMVVLLLRIDFENRQATAAKPKGGRTWSRM
jgi:cell division protein FtsW